MYLRDVDTALCCGTSTQTTLRLALSTKEWTYVGVTNLGEKCLVELEIFLLDVVETVVAVRDEHDGKGDELEQRSSVDDDSHQREYEHLDQTTDTLRQQDHDRVQSGHTQTGRGTVREEASNSCLTTPQPSKHRRRHRYTVPFAR